MNKLYLTYNEKRNRREYYSYAVLTNGPVYLTLSEREITGYLQKFITTPLKKVCEVTAHLMEIETMDGDVVMIDDIRVFSKTCDIHDSRVNELSTLISNHINLENIKNYKRKYPNYKGKRVKRNPRPVKIIIGGVSLGVATVLLATSLYGKLSQSKEKDNEEPKITIVNQIKPQVEEEIAYNSPEVNYEIDVPASEEIVPETESIKVAVAFDDLTEDGKLEQTIKNCSPYMDYWIERYNLPRDLTYAVLSQESGVLECIEQANGACGPMQIQLSAQHCEHYIVPVYKDGVLTGEYDEFWAADARKLDDPRLQGKPIKIIQNLEDNFQIGAAHFRRCIDRYEQIFIATDSNNKGLYALTMTYDACGDEIAQPLDYYKENLNDFSWTSIIPDHSKEVLGIENYGDPNYIWNVLRYLKTDTRGETTIDYDYKGNYVSVDILNTNVYNIDYERGK